MTISMLFDLNCTNGSKLIETEHGTTIIKSQAHYNEAWSIYKTEYSSFSYN
jgi:hypothetical protein